jgi:hypothetical protein
LQGRERTGLGSALRGARHRHDQQHGGDRHNLSSRIARDTNSGLVCTSVRPTAWDQNPPVLRQEVPAIWSKWRTRDCSRVSRSGANTQLRQGFLLTWPRCSSCRIDRIVPRDSAEF